jgi:uncharacterized membrane protein
MGLLFSVPVVGVVAGVAVGAAGARGMEALSDLGIDWASSRTSGRRSLQVHRRCSC